MGQEQSCPVLTYRQLHLHPVHAIHTGQWEASLPNCLFFITALISGIDLQAKNILISTKDDSILRELDENETSDPSPSNGH